MHPFFSGTVYQVILRGIAGQSILLVDCDRHYFYLMLQYIVQKFNCRIHCFFLMPNYVHLAVQTEDNSLSSTCRTFRTATRNGYLYTVTHRTNIQGRYKALILDAETYLMELVRHIHRTLVRSEMVTSPKPRASYLAPTSFIEY